MTTHREPPATQSNQRSDYAAAGQVECLFPGLGLPQVLRAPEPDREARAFLRMVNVSPRSSAKLISLENLRQSARLSALALGRRPAVAHTHELEIEGPNGPITLRLYYPKKSDAAQPALVWYFGGGFVVGDLDTADAICRNLALSADCITIAVRYRLAPEHDIAASREDAMAALSWVAANGAALGIDTTRLAVGGDSAGGNLAAAVAQQVQHVDGPPLLAQVLVYPATELVGRFPSYEQNIHGNYLLTEEVIQTLEGYLGTSMQTLDLTDPWFSPRRSADLRGLPPAIIVSAGFDPLRDDGLDYGMRLRAAGVAVQSLHYGGQFHGFLNFDAVLAASRDALQRIGEALALAFADQAPLDRTLEVVDQSLDCQVPLGHTAGEVASYTLAAWVASEGWSHTLLHLLSPRLARVCANVFKPVLKPLGLLRRAIAGRLSRINAEQTYPASATDA
ncbi:alpha/beta hydrolase [Pseudomonas sp. NPDC090755]|uniref:alpha/beta hydrolase n=1 Tax=Pseudomonas sp. NPDC090755 TaxID=3364481 RepID=UPI00383AD60D